MKPYKQSWETIVISSDTHVPFHNTALHRTFLKFLKDVQPDRFIVLGDFLDLASCGSYHADSLYYLKDLNLTQEYQAGNIVLDDYQKALPKKCKTTYFFGNHDARFFTWIKQGDHAKFGDEIRNPIDGLNLKKRHIEVFSDWMQDYIDIEHLRLLHGDSTAINVCSTQITKMGRSCVFGHTHRIQYATRGCLEAYNIGCMCDIDSPAFSYMMTHQREQWRNGFLVIHRNTATNEMFVQQVVATKDGSFVFGNQHYNN